MLFAWMGVVCNGLRDIIWCNLFIYFTVSVRLMGRENSGCLSAKVDAVFQSYRGIDFNTLNCVSRG